MKFKKLITHLLIILCFVAIFAFSGCILIPLGFGCQSCALSSLSYYYFTDELDNYSLCAFVDEDLGIGFKVYDGNNSSYVYWGYVTINGETRVACFDMYGNGDVNIYFSGEENGWSFSDRAAIVNFAFDNDDIICKSVEENYYNLDLSGLRLKYVGLDRSDFLPHEGSFTQSFSDKNQTVQAYRPSFDTCYIGKARTLKNGEIKTYDIRLAFLGDDMFEIYDKSTNELLSSGTYDIIGYDIATLKFGQNDNLYSEKPFDSYPYLTISGIFYKGIF